MMKKFRFGIIGCGRIAHRHALQIERTGQLVAVCDIVPEKACALAAPFKARAYDKLEDLLQEKEIDVISVCTPNGLHAAHVIKSLQAGFHVLCEKPMAISIADCQAMIRASEIAGKQLFIVKQNRFNPPVLALKQAIDNGHLGRLFSIQLNCYWNRDAAYYKESSWKGSKHLDGGILFTQFSHFIDLIYWMIGDVRQVSALQNNFAHLDTIESEDSGVVLLQFEGGQIGGLHYTVNSHGKNMEGSLTVFAQKGTVKIGGQYLNKLEYQDIEGFAFDDLPAGNRANNYGTYEGSMSNHDKVYDNLISALLNRAAMTTSAYEGLKTVEIIEKIYNAAIRL